MDNRNELRTKQFEKKKQANKQTSKQAKKKKERKKEIIPIHFPTPNPLFL